MISYSYFFQDVWSFHRSYLTLEFFINDVRYWDYIFSDTVPFLSLFVLHYPYIVFPFRVNYTQVFCDTLKFTWNLLHTSRLTPRSIGVYLPTRSFLPNLLRTYKYQLYRYSVSSVSRVSDTIRTTIPGCFVKFKIKELVFFYLD